MDQKVLSLEFRIQGLNPILGNALERFWEKPSNNVVAQFWNKVKRVDFVNNLLHFVVQTENKIIHVFTVLADAQCRLDQVEFHIACAQNNLITCVHISFFFVSATPSRMKNTKTSTLFLLYGSLPGLRIVTFVYTVRVLFCIVIGKIDDIKLCLQFVDRPSRDSRRKKIKKFIRK